jgi:[NiFe] hydrogenase diaphorase moiety small subunit
VSEPTPAPSTFRLDGHEVPFTPGQTLLQAILAAGDYVPHLCFHPDFPPHGSCRVCTVRVDGRPAASCATPATAGADVDSASTEVRADARTLVQFLFTEGDHFCPSCELSGRCTLQAVGYDLGVDSPHWHPMFPERPVDASHPDVWLDFDRCILCELCVRASADVDGKHVFALSGRGLGKHLIVNAESGRLGDTTFSGGDVAAHVCPVGVILPRGRGFDVPIGQRTYDQRPIREVAPEDYQRRHPAATEEP